MLLVERKNYNQAIMKVLFLGALIGLAWGFCAGFFFNVNSRPKPTAMVTMRGIEF